MNAAVTDLPKYAPLRANQVASRVRALRSPTDSSMVSVLTLVILVGCLAVGIMGLVLPYFRPQPHIKSAPPVTAELLNVELTSDPLPSVNPTPPPPTLAPPPPAVPPIETPPAQPMIAVAQPSQVAFAVPVQAAPIVATKEASFRTVETPIVTAPPAPAITPQPLTFGHGEGKQPKPEYPRQALREGQEGVVTMHVMIDGDGRVRAAEAVKPSAWPLLNNAALRVARTRWRFEPRGLLRTVEISVRFELSK